MIEYHLDYWQVLFIFRLKGSVFQKAIVFAVPSTILAVLLHIYVVRHDPDLNMSQFGSYNFVLGFLVVFRAQQAYSRFWEAATILQQVRGTWFNSISACFAFCSMMPEDALKVLKFKHTLVRLASLLYCTSLQQIAVCEDEAFEIISLEGFSEHHLQHLSKAPEKPLVILQWIQQLVVKGHNEGALKVPPPILSRVFQELSNGIVGIVDAQKISDISFPFPLAQMVGVMLIVSSAMTPVVLASTMANVYWCAILTFTTVFCFTGINFIAAEIEMPFGDDPNDLPMSTLQSSLNTALILLLDDESVSCPEFTLSEDSFHCDTGPCPKYLISENQHRTFKQDYNPNDMRKFDSDRSRRQTKIMRIKANGVDQLRPSDIVEKEDTFEIVADQLSAECHVDSTVPPDICSPFGREESQHAHAAGIRTLPEPVLKSSLHNGGFGKLKSSLQNPGFGLKLLEDLTRKKLEAQLKSHFSNLETHVSEISVILHEHVSELLEDIDGKVAAENGTIRLEMLSPKVDFSDVMEQGQSKVFPDWNKDQT